MVITGDGAGAKESSELMGVGGAGGLFAVGAGVGAW